MTDKNTEKPSVFVNATPSYGWRNRPDYKKENRAWLRKSMKIALRILDVLEEKNMSQQDLAVILSIQRQQINKILKGHENLTLQTITKIEDALGIELIEVLNGEDEDLVKNFLKQQRVTVTADAVTNIKIVRKWVGASLPRIAQKEYAYPGTPKEFVAGESKYAMAS